MGLFDLSRRRRGGSSRRNYGGGIINISNLANAKSKNATKAITMKKRLKKRRTHTSGVRGRIGRSRSRMHSHANSRSRSRSHSRSHSKSLA